jgi:hypothetical protein
MAQSDPTDDPRWADMYRYLRTRTPLQIQEEMSGPMPPEGGRFKIYFVSRGWFMRGV